MTQGFCRNILGPALAFLIAAPGTAAGPVTAMRVPQGGLQPQVAVGDDGTIHMTYYRGDPHTTRLDPGPRYGQ